jgi:hypothetical protein
VRGVRENGLLDCGQRVQTTDQPFDRFDQRAALVEQLGHLARSLFEMVVERTQVAGKEQSGELVRHERATRDQLVENAKTLGGSLDSAGFPASAREAHEVPVDLGSTERSIGSDRDREALIESHRYDLAAGQALDRRSAVDRRPSRTPRVLHAPCELRAEKGGLPAE